MIQIVTGAENVREGQYVLVAQIGASIANGMTMTSRTLQGHESQGMFCGLNELGFIDQQLSEQEQKDVYVIKNYPIKNLDDLIGHSINVIGFDDYS
jgi:phenylalanyl-tRNA synthetase beta chain